MKRFYLMSAVADPGFPWGGGGANSRGGAPTYYLANFSRKLHENKEILGPRGGGASLAIQCRSATGLIVLFLSLKKNQFVAFLCMCIGDITSPNLSQISIRVFQEMFTKKGKHCLNMFCQVCKFYSFCKCRFCLAYDSFNNGNGSIEGHYNWNVLVKLLVKRLIEFTGRGTQCRWADKDFTSHHLTRNWNRVMN